MTYLYNKIMGLMHETLYYGCRLFITPSTSVPPEIIIFTRFHEEKAKIVDFLSMADFEPVWVFSSSDFMSRKISKILNISSYCQTMCLRNQCTPPPDLKNERSNVNKIKNYPRLDSTHAAAQHGCSPGGNGLASKSMCRTGPFGKAIPLA